MRLTRPTTVLTWCALGQPLSWGPKGDFWKITGQKAFQSAPGCLRACFLSRVLLRVRKLPVDSIISISC